MKNNSDLLNSLAVVLALIVAFYLPYESFLYAYAILGPLHYLTEINWVRDKGFFVKAKRKWLILVILITIGIVLPKIYFTYFLTDGKTSFLFIGFSLFDQYSNGLIFLALILTWLFIAESISVKVKAIIVVLALILAVLLNTYPLYLVVIGLLIPTVVHVYIFTLLFMLSGGLKTKTSWPFVNIGVLALIPLLIAFIPFDFAGYQSSSFIKNSFLDIHFHHTNVLFSKFLGLSDGTSFYFYENLELRMQVFLSFAYIHHYLNWFVKTSIIGWHKSIDYKRGSYILIIWVSLVALFLTNYKLGFYAALSLSFLHVLLEFPINLRSIRQIGSSLKSKTI